MLINLPMPNATPKEVSKDQYSFTINWSDGHTSIYPYRYLRTKCPCALCTEDPKRKAKASNAPIMVMKVDQVGRYAFRFQFSDLHQIGIFTFTYLRSLCPCDECEQRE